MKKLILLFLILVPICMYGQERKYSTFYHQRASLFEELPVTTKDIIFLGNSITNGGEWAELCGNKNVKNRGISGDVTQGVYDRLDAIVKGHPKKIFLLIGINDLSGGKSPEYIINNIEKIVDKIKADSPKTQIYLQSILPVNDKFGMFGGHTNKGAEIKKCNEKMQVLAKNKSVTYIDLFSHFVEEGSEKMNPKYTNDGLHLLGAGYVLWAEIIRPYLK